MGLEPTTSIFGEDRTVPDFLNNINILLRHVPSWGGYCAAVLARLIGLSVERLGHCAREKLQCGPAVPVFRGEDLRHFSFVTNWTPEIANLALEPDKHFVQLPPPPGIRPTMDASSPDLRREHRPKPISPEPDRLVADIDAALGQEVLDLAQRQRIAGVHHHREADHFGRTVEVEEGIRHRPTLRIAPTRLKPIFSDRTPSGQPAAAVGGDGVALV